MERKQSKQAGKTALPDAEFFIDRTLAFANQIYAGSAQEAEQLLLEPAGIRFVVEGKQPSVKRIHEVQDHTRYLLSDIASAATAGGDRLLAHPALSKAREREINSRLRGEVWAHPQLKDGELTYVYDVKSITAAASLGVALLFEAGQAQWLRECGQCGNFFFAEGQHSNARFCRGECREMNDQEKARQRKQRYDAKQKKRRTTKRGK